MDVLRFMRGAAPPQPPVPPPAAGAATMSAQRQRQPPRAAPPLRVWPRGGGDSGPAPAGASVRGAEPRSPPDEERKAEGDERRQGNWVLQMLRVQPRWVDAADAEATGGGGQEPEEETKSAAAAAPGGVEECASCVSGEGDEGCAVGYDDGEVFDRASFSRLLRKASLREAQEYSMMSYLCNIAYMIPRIQPKCLRRYNLRFVTSSVQDKAGTSPDQKQEHSAKKDESGDQESEPVDNAVPASKGERSGLGINPFGAYHVVSSAASYLHSRAMGIMPFGSGNDVKDDPTIMAFVSGESSEGLSMDEASFVATTNSVTSMVAAKEETRQAVADDLNSSRSCPVSGSSAMMIKTAQDTLWFRAQNQLLLGRPTFYLNLSNLRNWTCWFTGGIYEAAKGIYHQMLPYVKAHLKSCGKAARLRFTGHSLGGSLALLVNLMLLMRGEAPAASLLPVITFGAPCIMCGGDHLIRRLGLPRSHVQSITMHRDIVPRVFSCHYPGHVANILKLANGNFRSHPCLTNQKLLYAPMGEVLILQPNERLSPHHHLLPPDSGIYHLAGGGGEGASSASASGDDGSLPQQLRSALSAFFNSPHPLEILKDGAAYGPRGSVYRDHDVNSYLRSVRAVVRKEARRAREAERERWGACSCGGRSACAGASWTPSARRPGARTCCWWWWCPRSCSLLAVVRFR